MRNIRVAAVFLHAIHMPTVAGCCQQPLRRRRKRVDHIIPRRPYLPRRPFTIDLVDLRPFWNEPIVVRRLDRSGLHNRNRRGDAYVALHRQRRQAVLVFVANCCYKQLPVIRLRQCRYLGLRSVIDHVPLAIFADAIHQAAIVRARNQRPVFLEQQASQLLLITRKELLRLADRISRRHPVHCCRSTSRDVEFALLIEGHVPDVLRLALHLCRVENYLGLAFIHSRGARMQPIHLPARQCRSVDKAIRPHSHHLHRKVLALE